MYVHGNTSMMLHQLRVVISSFFANELLQALALSSARCFRGTNPDVCEPKASVCEFPYKFVHTHDW